MIDFITNYLWIVILVIIAIIVIARTIRIVPQSYAYVVERIGAYNRTCNVGLHILIPLLDRISNKVSLKEQVIDFAPQPVITKDNVTMQIDTVVYFQITDPKLFTYGVVRPLNAIENLTATTLRNIIGDLELDETLTSRDIINSRMRSILDEATDPWGIKVHRVEVKNIIPPRDIQEAMEKQMRAERERRESILQAEGEKQSSILRAEGEKQSAILRAEAKKEAMIREAEGDKQSRILKAQGDAESIREVAKAKAEGESVVIEQVFKAMKDADIDDNMLALKSMEALEKVAQGKSTKLVLPSDAVNFLGTFKGIKEVMKDDDDIKININNKEESQE